VPGTDDDKEGTMDLSLTDGEVIIAALLIIIVIVLLSGWRFRA
jgi:hypothetical protein